MLMMLVWANGVYAVPETVSVRVTDVTTSSFALVWMTDVVATPTVEVYSDSAMANSLADRITVIPMPDVPAVVALAAGNRGIMKVRVAGLDANSTYYVRSVTADPVNPASIAYSGLQTVTTGKEVRPYQSIGDGTLRGAGNDLITTRIYIRPSDTDSAPGQGDLILFETPVSPYPISAFVGSGTTAPEGVLDLNNLFGLDLNSLFIQGGEKSMLTIYRGGTLASLVHYRWLPANSAAVTVAEPVKGFFADFNLDGKVDELDFAEFRKQYRKSPDDPAYNPDYKFVASPSGTIDAQDFTRFSREYGRTGVQ